MSEKIDKTKLPDEIKSLYVNNLDYMDIISVKRYSDRHYRVYFRDGKSDDWKYYSGDWNYEVKYD